MMYRKGQKVIHDLTGKMVTIAERGHYPDTIMVEVEPEKQGETPRQVEVYLRHLSELQGSTS